MTTKEAIDIILTIKDVGYFTDEGNEAFDKAIEALNKETVYIEAIQLHNETGCSMQDSIKAIEYSNSHIGCTPLGYIKAISLAVSTPSFSFEERVRWFSER